MIHTGDLRSDRVSLETRRGPILSVPEAARHVLSVTGITLLRQRCRLGAQHGGLSAHFMGTVVRAPRGIIRAPLSGTVSSNFLIVSASVSMTISASGSMILSTSVSVSVSVSRSRQCERQQRRELPQSVPLGSSSSDAS